MLLHIGLIWYFDTAFAINSSNFLGTNFTVYSNGRNPNISAQDDDEKKRDKEIREELGSVIYVKWCTFCRSLCKFVHLLFLVVCNGCLGT